MDNNYQLKIYDEIQKRHQLWKNIANKSGEHNVEDVMIEAWLFTRENWKKSEIFKIDDEEDRKYLYGAIDNKLVKFSEKNIKYGVRIDQSYLRNSFEESEHPVLKTLFSNSDLEPLKQLENVEEEQNYEQNFNQQIKLLGYSKLSAFLILSHSFNTSRIQTAHLMNMSYSWFYESGKVFQKIYSIQNSLFDELNVEIPLEQLKSWRRFRVVHEKKKVEFGQLHLSF